MKKVSLLLVIVMLFAFLTSCSEKKELEDFEMLNNGLGLKRGDRTYSFFDVLPNISLKGEQFGVVDGDKKHKIYYVKGYSPDEWVIEYYDVIMSIYSLYKANTVTEIPVELQSQ